MNSREQFRAVIIASALLHTICGGVEVVTKLGTIRGSTFKTTVNHVDYIVNRFLGIPYAKPPIGEMRFQRPEPMPEFDSPFEALAFGSACPQADFPGTPVYNNKSEDCLYLNVYVPEETPDKDTGHAVMVFIYGGGFILGAAESYPCEELSAFGNVILVTINYRLGVFGFTDTEDGKIPGNMGFHDQHLALKWVNQNIGYFGGDQNRVTIFGQSAGGSSVVFQGLYPKNKGLIHRVISESGVPTAKGIIKENPRKSFLILAKELGCDTTTIDIAIACTKSVNTDTIMEKLKEMSTDPEKIMAAQFQPTVDGDIIKMAPHLLASVAKNVDLEQLEFFRSLDFISGFTDQEGGVFLLTPLYPIEDLETFTLPRYDFITKAAPTALTVATGHFPDFIKSIIMAEYTNWTNPTLPVNNRDQYVRLLGDIYFTVGSVEMSRLHSNATVNTSKTYAYVFTATPTNRALITPTWFKGANHGDEMAFVFALSQKFLDDVFTNREIKPFEDWEYDLSNRMVTYWTNFAKSG